MKKIYLAEPFFGIEEFFMGCSMLKTLKQHRYGIWTKKVEEMISQLMSVKYSFLTTSCTSALELSLWIYEFPPGFEAIIPSFTFVSTANAVIRQKGKPVFVDIERKTLNINPDLIEDKVNEKTKVIIPVHYAGVGCNMEKIINIAKKHNLVIIEDAAHAFGAKFNNKYLGTFGDIGCFSFHITKNFTCGEGGAIVTDNELLARKIEIFRDKGTNRAQFIRKEINKYDWISEGSSYVISDFLSMLLYHQLKKFKKNNYLRKKKAEYLYYQLGKSNLKEYITFPNKEILENSNYHICYILVKDERDRNPLIEYLNQKGIESAFHYQPLHLSPYIKNKYIINESLPVTEEVASKIVRLPIYPQIKKSQIRYIVRTIKNFFKGI